MPTSYSFCYNDIFFVSKIVSIRNRKYIFFYYFQINFWIWTVFLFEILFNKFPSFLKRKFPLLFFSNFYFRYKLNGMSTESCGRYRTRAQKVYNENRPQSSSEIWHSRSVDSILLCSRPSMFDYSVAYFPFVIRIFLAYKVNKN